MSDPQMYSEPAGMGIVMAVFIAYYFFGGYGVVSLFRLVFSGLKYLGHPNNRMPGTGLDEDSIWVNSLKWPDKTPPPGWAIGLYMVSMALAGTGAGFFYWSGATTDQIWIAAMALMLIAPFWIVVTSWTYEKTRNPSLHAAMAFLLFAICASDFGCALAYAFNNSTTYSQLGAWFQTGIVLCSGVYAAWTIAFYIQNPPDEVMTDERHEIKFHTQERHFAMDTIDKLKQLRASLGKEAREGPIVTKGMLTGANFGSPVHVVQERFSRGLQNDLKRPAKNVYGKGTSYSDSSLHGLQMV